MRFLILKFISGVNDFNAIQFSKNTLCCTYFLGYGAITTITLNNFIGIFIFIVINNFIFFCF
ncbi:Uncharacterised protein [Salmonella enterica subsp. enterica]|nr:Uncharacterised protein [Salmonella enterica subsp. enterica]